MYPPDRDLGPLFDQPRKNAGDARRAREHGMKRVSKNADPVWNAEAEQLLDGYLRTHAEFFVDDFWSETGLREPREARALGPIVQQASRRGQIVKTGRSKPSVRSNMSDKPIWRSMIYRSDAA